MAVRPEDNPEWVPTAIHWRESVPVVEWRCMGGIRFTHPFFRDSVKAAAGAASHETTLERLRELAASHPCSPPAGFIFHLSRCGSTLVSQMLAALPGHVVLSEPEPVNHLLWPDGCLAPRDIDSETPLRWVLGVLGRRRHSAEQRMFVKFDAWHTLSLPVIRRAFPQVPWIFVYRDPVEILVSHALSPGSHVIPGILELEHFGIPRPSWTESGLRHYAAGVIALIAGAVLEHADAGARLVHYQELPAALPGILRHFNADVSARELDRMLAIAARHSKDPQREFAPDSARRQAMADPALRDIAERAMGGIYAELEARRAAQIPR